MRRTASAALVACVVLAMLSVPVAASDGVVALDDDQHLATDQAATEYERSGSVTMEAEDIQLSVTIADDPEVVDAPGWHMGQLKRFVRVDYNESISRTVRLHIHDEIVVPRPSKGTTPLGADGPTADFVTPLDGHQSVTLHLSGETHAVYGLSDLNGELWAIRETVSGVWGNATGVQLPSFGGGEWQRPPSDALEGTNPTYTVPKSDEVDDMTVQYNADGESWLTVPECQADAPVCQLQRNNSTVLFASDANPPDVRYKLQRDALAGVKSAWSDLASIPTDVADALGGLVGGGA